MMLWENNNYVGIPQRHVGFVGHPGQTVEKVMVDPLSFPKSDRFGGAT